MTWVQEFLDMSRVRNILYKRLIRSIVMSMSSSNPVRNILYKRLIPGMFALGSGGVIVRNILYKRLIPLYLFFMRLPVTGQKYTL